MRRSLKTPSTLEGCYRRTEAINKIPNEFKIGQLAYVHGQCSLYFLGFESCTKADGHFSEDYFHPFHDMHIRQRKVVVL